MEFLSTASPVAILVVGGLILTVAVALVLAALTTGRRIAVPAVVWLGAPLGLYLLTWMANSARLAGVAGRVAALPDAQVADALIAEQVAAWTIDAVGWAGSAAALLIAAWIAAAAHRVAFGTGRSTLAHGIPALGFGAVGAATLVVGAVLFDAAPLGAALQGACLIVGSGALALAASRRGANREDDTRVAASRGLVAFATTLAVIAVGIAGVELQVAGAAHVVLRAAPDDRLAVAAVQLPVLPSVLAALGGCVFAWFAAMPTTALAGKALVHTRTVVGAVAIGVLGVSPLVLRAMHQPAMVRLAEGLRAGAVGDRHATLIARGVPSPRTLSGLATATEPLAGSCLVVADPAGFTAQAMFSYRDPQTEVDRRFDATPGAEEIERKAACPRTSAPLVEPLSRFEEPLVAVAADRLAPALTGHRWFLRQGTVHLLLGPESEAARAESPEVMSHVWRSVPFHWEMPPATEPAPDPEPGEQRVWDFEYASHLPVTLLEGRSIVLVAGGSREILPGGDRGVARLQKALLSQERRDLVFVPRRRWQVQDLASICLSVIGEVEGARCVLRPENTDQWSMRTGLPLPWTYVTDEEVEDTDAG